MSDAMKKTIRIIFLLIVFFVSVALVIVGQREIGAKGLLTQLIGLVGLVFLLWNYNRKFK